MVLTACEECGKSISDRAPNCPHCGAPSALMPALPAPPSTQQPTPAAVAKDDQKSGKGRKIFIAILCIIAFIAIIQASQKTTTATGDAQPDIGSLSVKSAYAFCAGLKATGLLTDQCKVSGWDRSVDVTVDM